MQTPGSILSTATESLNIMNARPATPKKQVPQEKQKEIIVEEKKPIEESKDTNSIRLASVPSIMTYQSEGGL